MNKHLLIKSILKKYFWESKDIAPLVTFRILFGALMAYGGIRFVLNGWIEKLYLEPVFFFKFYGFEWVEPFGETGMYCLFFVIVLSAVGIMLGLFYRWATILFFICFTYVELIDATNYLNHYYLVCLFSFLLIFIPANKSFSLDVLINRNNKLDQVPAWTINVLIAQLIIVYTFAGIAKLNGDWLLRAMPLAIWLPEHTDLPILGYFFQFKWVAYLMSWAGAFYDLTIAGFLLCRKTRPLAYLMVVVFHMLTYVLFNIGLFPFIMIFSTLIFFSASFHQKLLGFIGYRRFARWNGKRLLVENDVVLWRKKLVQTGLAIYLFLQVSIPLRSLFYSGDSFWTEQGYRFSWRVMLVEKNGLATFFVHDPQTGRSAEIVNGNYLTLFQEKQLSIQPDFMIQYAQFLKEEYRSKHNIKNPKITVESHVAMNGRVSQLFIDPSVDLANIKDGWRNKDWILADAEMIRLKTPFGLIKK